jgi:RNAse (barnase) inhibitor barstar
MSDKLLKNAGASGVFHLPPSRQPAIGKAAQRAGFCVLTADLGSQASAHDVLLQLGLALHFPPWYGANFDALFDCLTDPDWQPAEGHLLLINGLAHFHSSAPTDCATLIEVLQAAAETRRAMHKPFWALLDTRLNAIPSFPKA